MTTPTDNPLRSMTGFASGNGDAEGYRWTAEIRGVNNKGLDLRLRVPDWVDGLEVTLRKMISDAVKRGSITLSLRLSRDDETAPVGLNGVQLRAVIDALKAIEGEAAVKGYSLSQTTAADIASVRGVLESKSNDNDTAPVRQALLPQIEELIDAFDDMRQKEGTRLGALLRTQLDQLSALIVEADELAEARKGQMAESLRTNLKRVLEAADRIDEDRVAQELALLAVKADVTEEIDRLSAHVSAAHDLIEQGGPIGRKLDFLMQEFNREANTLCSKSQDTDLTRVGLELKALIDQMREQVQNVE